MCSFREVKEHYWPDGDMGMDVEEDMEKLKDIYRYQSNQIVMLLFLLTTSMSYFMSSMDTDSKLLASAGLPVFTFLLNQPAAFSLSILFSLSLSKLGMMFTKHAVGLSIPKPRGRLNVLYSGRHGCLQVSATATTSVTSSP